jgi:DNA-binding NtrC family response regulator
MAIVLVVEDDEQVRVLAESILQEAAHTTLSAAGLEAAQAILDSEEDIDILFTDLGLGSDLEGGLKVGRHAADKRPGIRVIYTTGQGITDGMRALFVEPSMLLPKPYTADQLTTAIGTIFPS